MRSVRCEKLTVIDMNTFNITRLAFIGIFEPWVLLFSIFGNLIVIYVMTRRAKLKRQSNYYIVSLALADLLTGVIVVPLSLNAVNI